MNKKSVFLAANVHRQKTLIISMSSPKRPSDKDLRIDGSTFFIENINTKGDKRKSAFNKHIAAHPNEEIKNYKTYMKMWLQKRHAEKNNNIPLVPDVRLSSDDDENYQPSDPDSSISGEDINGSQDVHNIRNSNRGSLQATAALAEGEGGNSKSRTQRAGLQFPVGRIERYLKQGKYASRITDTAPVSMAAYLEYLAAEILEVAGDAANKAKKKRITPRHIKLAVRKDKELDSLLAKIIIADGGVLPDNIHNELLPKRNPEKSARISTYKKKIRTLATALSGEGEVWVRPQYDDIPLDVKLQEFEKWEHKFAQVKKFFGRKERVDINSDDFVNAAIDTQPIINGLAMDVLDAFITVAKEFVGEAHPMEPVLSFYQNWSREHLITRLLGSRVMSYNGATQAWYDDRLKMMNGTVKVEYRDAINGKFKEYLLPEEGPLAALFAMRFSTTVYNDGQPNNRGRKPTEDDHVKYAFVYGICGVQKDVEMGFLSLEPKDPFDIAMGLVLDNIYTKYFSEAEMPDVTLSGVSIKRYVARTFVVLLNIFEDLSEDRHFTGGVGDGVVLRLRFDYTVDSENPRKFKNAYGMALHKAIHRTIKRGSPILAIEINGLSKHEAGRYGGIINMQLQNKKIPVLWNSPHNPLAHIDVDIRKHIDPLNEKEISLATNFSWDGMSLPGGPFWTGKDTNDISDSASIAWATDIPFFGVNFMLPGTYLPKRKCRQH